MNEDFKFLADFNINDFSKDGNFDFIDSFNNYIDKNYDNICESMREKNLTEEELENLIKHDHLLLFLHYSSLTDKCNYFLNSAKHLKAHVNDLLNKLKSKICIIDLLENENSQLKQELELIKSENSRLQAQLAHLSQRNSRAGRPRYNSDFRQRVIDFYNESDAHTYQATAQEFNISTNTVGRILKENA